MLLIYSCQFAGFCFVVVTGFVFLLIFFFFSVTLSFDTLLVLVVVSSGRILGLSDGALQKSHFLNLEVQVPEHLNSWSTTYQGFMALAGHCN